MLARWRRGGAGRAGLLRLSLSAWETVEDHTEVGAALRRADHLRPPVESLYCYIARPVFAESSRNCVPPQGSGSRKPEEAAGQYWTLLDEDLVDNRPQGRQGKGGNFAKMDGKLP